MGVASVWPVVFGARLLERFGAGSRSAPRDALIASSVSEENRGRRVRAGGGRRQCRGLFGTLGGRLSALLDSRRYPFRLLPRCHSRSAGLLLVLLVKERPAANAAKAKIDAGLGQFSTVYWIYLAVTALFGLGNSSNAFLILRTRDIGVSLESTILIYAAFNLVDVLASYPGAHYPVGGAARMSCSSHSLFF